MTAQTRDEFLTAWANSLSDGGSFNDTKRQLDLMLDAWDDNTAERAKEERAQATEEVAIALYNAYRKNWCIAPLPWVNLSGAEKDRWRDRATRAQTDANDWDV